MARKSVSGGWYLDSLSRSQFLRNLNNHQYTAVLTQILDWFVKNGDNTVQY